MPGSPSDPGLIYLRVADRLRGQITDGSYAPGDRLPNQHDLAKESGVSLSTLTNALNVLERELYIVRKAGKGTYVALPEEHSLVALIVDDEENIRNLLAVFLNAQGWKCVCVSSGKDALDAVRVQKFDLVFMDLIMPITNGADTFRRLREVDPSINVVIVTAYPDSDLVWEALLIGPFAMLGKPIALDNLEMFLDSAAAVAALKDLTPRPSARLR